MRKNSLTFALLFAVFTLAMSIAGNAQQAPQATTAKPYHSGPVWNIGFIRVKAGMDDRYKGYLAEGWKREQEALKKAGYILDYKAIQTETHGSEDFNVILMTEFKDLASMEANEEKAQALAEQMFGGAPKIESGYQERSSYREVVGGRLGREIIFEPKAGSSK